MTLSSFSARTRQQTIDALKESSQIYDLVIIGGGITGAGVARDAASRGMKVLLVEANDFASGTSSRSSKLIHGGLRYLEHMEFKLVFEALSERKLLFEIAPHMVHPLRFVLPVFKNSRVGMFKLGCGMWLYDALSMFDAPQMHEHLNSEETMARIPELKTEGLCGAYAYSDAYMDDDRLVIETLRDAHRRGAQSVNYVSAVGADWCEGKIHRIKCRDEISGEEFTVSTHHTVSTVGPWTDEVAAQLLPDWKKILKPSKGIHLTLPRERLPLKDCVVMTDDEKQRIVFGIPRHEMVIVGTTDTQYESDPRGVQASNEDVEYLNQLVNEFFPQAHLQVDDYIASYAGVRPLVASGEANVGKTSREHTIFTDLRGVTFVAGGKYTTYRRMAEEIVDETLNVFPIQKKAEWQRSQTKTPLNEKASLSELKKSEESIQYWVRESGLNEASVRELALRHGMETEDILNKIDQTSGTEAEEKRWQLEALHALETTMCHHLVDFYTRRSPLFLAQKDHGLGLLPQIAEVFREHYNWSDEKEKSELQALHSFVERELHWQV